MKKKEAENQTKSLPKTLSGIKGLNEISGGGLPTGRATLVCGNAGCGKTLFAMEFIAGAQPSIMNRGFYGIRGN